MNNPTTATPINGTTNPSTSAPVTEQKNPAPQADITPIAVGGDLKTETKTDVVKENKDIKAV